MDLHPVYDIDTETDHRITRGFVGAFSIGVACKQRTPALRTPANAPIAETSFLGVVVSRISP